MLRITRRSLLAVSLIILGLVAALMQPPAARASTLPICNGTAITNMTDLQNIENDLDGTYCLMNNIDASGVTFTPIGQSTEFSGDFDGNGHVIKNLSITLSSSYYVGLFAHTSNATIKNVGLVNETVAGDGQTGGLVGDAYSTTIDAVFTTGTVTSTGQMVGGMVGSLTSGSYGTSTISDSYSTASVTAQATAGGLVGWLQDTGSSVARSYAASVVTLTGSSFQDAGGLAGEMVYGPSFTNSYWDTEKTILGVGNPTAVAGITGLSETQMVESASFAGFDFSTAAPPHVGTWAIATGANSGYPSLQEFAPAIISLDRAGFAVGQPSSFTVMATGDPAPSLSETGTLPSGLSFVGTSNGTATISGTPNAGTNGNYPLTITAASGGTQVTQNFTLRVDVPDQSQVTVTSVTTLDGGQSNMVFAQIFTAGKTGPLDRVSVGLVRFASATTSFDDVTVKIETVMNTGYYDQPNDNNVIGTGTIPAGAVPRPAYGWDPWTFVDAFIPEQPTLTAGTKYAIVLQVASYEGYGLAFNSPGSGGTDSFPDGVMMDRSSGSTSWYCYMYCNEDLVFKTFLMSAGPDTTPPTIVNQAPSSGATDVPLDTTVSVTFSEPMNINTFTSSAFYLSPSRGKAVATMLSFSPDLKTATLTLPTTSTLSAGTTYTATVVGGSKGVKDQAGNPLGSTATWSFVTAAAPVSVPSTPGIPTPSTYVNSGSFTLTWAASVGGSGKITYTLQHSNDNGSTWDQVASGITTNSYAFGGRNAPEAAGNWNYQVQAIAGGTSSDWSPWSVLVTVDRTVPTVVSTSPANAEGYIMPNAVVTVTFSEPMLGSSITSDTIYLSPSKGKKVSAAVTLSGDGLTATLTPSSPLAYFTSYTGTVVAGSRGVKDQVGNSMTANYTWNFVTSP